MVDDKNDESVKIIENISSVNAANTKLVIAGKAANEGQKVHNLRCAVLEIAAEKRGFRFCGFGRATERELAAKFDRAVT